ncbi:MAG TPA: ABC-2 family transporter protein, partial [Ktedonobacteraceae bacterium]|nr:ABC-2 family transporter protein [Ktedonobacteraceae bacterium]
LALSQVVMGLLVVGLGERDPGTFPAWWAVLAWLLLISAGLIIAWALRILIASASLWASSIELDILYSSLWQFGRYPVEVYRQPLRFVLTYVLPFAFLATFPTRALTDHGSSLLLPLLGIGTSGVAIIIARFVWTAGLRRYTSATS